MRNREKISYFPPSKVVRLVQNNPVNFRDLRGLAISDIKNNASGSTYSITDIINTADFAETICKNSKYLATKTAKHVNEKGQQYVQDTLDKITVVTGADTELVKGLAQAIGYSEQMADLLINGDAFSVGGTIFFFDAATDFSFIDDRYLTKHEAIHYLQSEAEGSTAKFLSEYKKSIGSGTANDYYGSQYEMAAYSFGPNVNTKSYYNPLGSSNKGFIK